MKLRAKEKTNWKSPIEYGLIVLAILLPCGCSRTTVTTAVTEEQKTFATPAEAGQALATASRAQDESTLAHILGSESKAILNSGDAVEDKAALDSFVAKYERMNRWVTLTDGSRILYIGADNYPFPIPLAQDSAQKWYFDTSAGEDEILARRIGRNELLAIDASSAIANAQELYFKKPLAPHSTHQYAQRIISSPGTHDGLYWDVPEGRTASPLGRLPDFIGIISGSEPQIFDGYRFRILNAQGSAAKGGSRSYISDGQMTGGFAVIANPVKYGDSGIMTFMLNREGVVYQKDLGEKTGDIAASINEYNPTDGWTQAE